MLICASRVKKSVCFSSDCGCFPPGIFLGKTFDLVKSQVEETPMSAVFRLRHRPV